MFKYIKKICIIGNGVHSQRIQKIIKKKKINFIVFKPKSKKNYKKENLENFKKYKIFFIISPNNTHFYYISKFCKNSYIFCEKPPTNNLKELNKLKKINSNKIYFNFNFRFSRISKILSESKKFGLGKLIYSNIISGHGLAFKDIYKNSWRADKKNCPTGVFEMLAIHWIDLINYLFKIKKIKNFELKNLSKIGNSYDNCNLSLQTHNNAVIDVVCSYTSPVISKKTFIFKNGLILQDEDKIEIRGPALNIDKDNFLKKPKLIKKEVLDEKKDYNESLKLSIDYFFKQINEKRKFSKKEFHDSLKINKLIL